jgi:hypothetical protein
VKKVTLGFIILIGAYTLLRNNVGVLPERLVWTSSPDIFYKVFIPLLMIVSGIVAFARRGNVKYFSLAFGVMFIDAINRLALGVNHIVLYQRYKGIPQPEPSPNSVVVVTNLWPSHIIVLIEAALIIFVVFGLRPKRTDQLSS